MADARYPSPVPSSAPAPTQADVDAYRRNSEARYAAANPLPGPFSAPSGSTPGARVVNAPSAPAQPNVGPVTTQTIVGPANPASTQAPVVRVPLNSRDNIGSYDPALDAQSMQVLAGHNMPSASTPGYLKSRGEYAAEERAGREAIARQEDMDESRRRAIAEALGLKNAAEDRTRKIDAENSARARMEQQEAYKADAQRQELEFRRQWSATHGGMPWSDAMEKHMATLEENRRIAGDHESRYRQLAAQETEFNQMLDMLQSGGQVPREIADVLQGYGIKPGSKLEAKDIEALKVRFKEDTDRERELAQLILANQSGQLRLTGKLGQEQQQY